MRGSKAVPASPFRRSRQHYGVHAQIRTPLAMVIRRSAAAALDLRERRVDPPDE
jgi:hypothetical protein